MRFLTGFPLRALALGALALLTFSTPAFAYAIHMTTTYAGQALNISDTVTVDVFLDADPGLTFYSSAVIFDNAGELVYDGPGSAALPPNPNCTPPNCGPGTSGAQPSYILYGPPGSMNMPPATLLYPVMTPHWFNWAGFNPPGFTQVNIDFVEATFATATASGTGIYLATLLFNVAATGDGSAIINQCVTCGGNIIQSGALPPIPPSDIPLTGGPIVVNLPEPAIASLALAGLTTLYLVRRRRA